MQNESRQHHQSFTAEEVVLLDAIVQAILRGAPTTMVIRSSAFPSVARKIVALKESVERSEP